MAVAAATAGVAAALIAAGSVGLLGHPLRHALTWLAMAAALVMGWPAGTRWGTRLLIVAAALAAVAMTASPLPVLNVLAVALLLGVLAAAQLEDQGARSALAVAA